MSMVFGEFFLIFIVKLVENLFTFSLISNMMKEKDFEEMFFYANHYFSSSFSTSYLFL